MRSNGTGQERYHDASEAADSDNGRVAAVTERRVDAFRYRCCSGCCPYEARLSCVCVVVMRLRCARIGPAIGRASLLGWRGAAREYPPRRGGAEGRVGHM